jgi:hypothetical protein
MVFGSGIAGTQIEPADLPFVNTFPDSLYAISWVAHGVTNEVTLYVAALKSLSGASIPWKKFCDVEDDVTSFDLWQSAELTLPAVR